MNIPTDKIEDWAVREVQLLADENNSIVPEIANHDKGMSYDGFFWLFKKDAPHNKENCEDRIFVQLKGHIDDKREYINKQRISYPVEIADLRVYSQKEGVVYFQVFETSDRSKREVFYATLYSSKIKSYLQRAKDNQKDKSIIFTKMRKSGDELYSILKQFSRESKKQGSIHTDTVENMIPLNGLASLKEIHFEAVAVKNEFDVLRRLSAGDICVYGRTSDMPFRFAQYLCDRLQNGSPLYKINELQIKTRKGSLSSEDIGILEDIINNSEIPSIVCAAHILRGNMKLAKNILEKLDADERKMIEELPIYSLMK